MSSSVRGLVVAGGTAVAVVVVGLVFAGVGRSPPDAKPAVPTTADQSTLTLEARRHARLEQSQAMLGGGKPVPEEPAQPVAPPSEAPPPPAPPAPSPPPRPSPMPAESAPGRPAAAAAPAAGAVAPLVVAMPPPPEHACTVATSGSTPMAEACRHGGRPEAKQVMKRLVAGARARGARYTCDSCHLDVESYLLRENARSELTSLLDHSK